MDYDTALVNRFASALDFASKSERVSKKLAIHVLESCLKRLACSHVWSKLLTADEHRELRWCALCRTLEYLDPRFPPSNIGGAKFDTLHTFGPYHSPLKPGELDDAEARLADSIKRGASVMGDRAPTSRALGDFQ